MDTFLQFAIAAAAIVASGIYLTKFADNIGEQTGLPQLLTGMVLIAAATSLPELAVSISAARQDLPDIAVGGLFGSSLFNLLILGVIDLIYRSKGRVLSRVSAAHALSGTMSISLTALPALAIAANAGTAIGTVSWGSVGILATYLLGARLVYYDQVFQIERVEEDLPTTRRKRDYRPFVGFGVCALTIIVAAPFLSGAAGEITTATGLHESFVGTALVALATSLPEVVTTFAASRLGSVALAVGNIFGSNSFNIFVCAIADIFFTGSLFAAASPVHIVTCIFAIFITAIVIMGQIYHVEKRIIFFEPDALLVITMVIFALGVIYKLPL